MYYFFEIVDLEQYILLQISTDYSALIDMKNKFEKSYSYHKYIILKEVNIWRV